MNFFYFLNAVISFAVSYYFLQSRGGVLRQLLVALFFFLGVYQGVAYLVLIGVIPSFNGLLIKITNALFTILNGFFLYYVYKHHGK